MLPRGCLAAWLHVTDKGPGDDTPDVCTASHLFPLPSQWLTTRRPPRSLLRVQPRPPPCPLLSCGPHLTATGALLDPRGWSSHQPVFHVCYRSKLALHKPLMPPALVSPNVTWAKGCMTCTDPKATSVSLLSACLRGRVSYRPGPLGTPFLENQDFGGPAGLTPP